MSNLPPDPPGAHSDHCPIPAAAEARAIASRLLEDVAHLVGHIDQVVALPPDAVLHLGDWRTLRMPSDPLARRRLAVLIIVQETTNFLRAYGIGPAGYALLSELVMALGDCARGVTSPLLRVAPHAAEDGAAAWRRRPDRIDEDMMIGAATAAIWRRAQAGERRAAAAAAVAALLDGCGLETPSEKRRGKDEPGTPDPARRRWTGPRLLAQLYQVQRYRRPVENGEVVNNAAGRRARFFVHALRSTEKIHDRRTAARTIEAEIGARLARKTL